MNKRILILVEGQTEERLVKDLLAPELWLREIYVAPTIVETKRVKDGRKIITYALIGIAVVFASWLIVTTFVKILGGVQSL